MYENFLFFGLSFLADTLALIFYQHYIDSRRKDLAFLLYAVVAAILVWIFIFKLQDRGQTLRFFIPIWAGGSAVFGYFFAGLAAKTPVKELLNIQALFWVVLVSVGIYFLNRLSA